MKPASGTRKPYIGNTRNLVLALDVGTTFSGVSYAILEPGDVPKIHGVTRFPGQEHVAGNSKIPSIMYYDQDGLIQAAGAEAEGATIVAMAEDEGWIKAELFKLRLRPKTMKLKMNGMRLAPLPHGKTAVDVFGDFLGYLFQCTRSFIIDTHANGQGLWKAVEHDIQFVLSHPNGWEGAQQSKMRRAAVYGGLIPDTDEGKSRIRFVTEGEASLHACVLNGLAADVLSNPSGNGFIVADAGGGTLDISSYAIRGTSPLVIEEIAPPDCVFAGSVFVSRRARAFFEEKLRNSKYGTPDSLDHITKRFDETTKRLFRDTKDLQFVPFGSPLDKDLPVGIRGGQLKLTGAEVAALFEPSIEAAVMSIKSQIDASNGTIKSVWLVGGFAASPWLFAQLQDRLARYHVVVSRPDTQTSKAVADGAIGFYCDHHVSARVSKFMYGVEYLREFDPNDEEHIARKHRLFEMPSGPKLMPDAFDCILARSVKVKESSVFSRKYCTEVTSLSTLSVFEVEVWCYRGGDAIPKWIHRHSEEFSTLCYVRADLSPLAGSAQAKQSKNGKTYWTIVFSIEIHFGLTEFKARIKWVDNTKTRYGPASIVYNEGGHRAEEDEPDSSPEDNVTVLSSPSDRGPSRSVSNPPSRDPSMRSARPSTYASPHLPTQPIPEPQITSRGFDLEQRTRTASMSSSASKGKSRSMSGGGSQTPRSAAPMPEPMHSGDRSMNVSGRSAESGRSGSTRLGEELNEIWGNAPNVSSPLAENPPYNAFSQAHSRQSSRRGTKPSTPRVPTPPREPSRPPSPPPPAIPKQPTPPTMSTLQTPIMAPPPLAPEERRPRPASELSYATVAPPSAAPSKPPTPPPVEPVTPTRATPATSKIPTPTSNSKAATPAWGSKANSARGSKIPTPAATSKVATPAATSKAATPKSLSKAATPKASKAATPTAATPRAMTPPPPPEPVPEPAPVVEVPTVEVVEPPPEPAAPAAAPETAWGLEHHAEPATAHTSTLFADPIPPTSAPSTLFDDDGVVPPLPGEMPMGDGPPPPVGVMSPIADLWSTPVPEQEQPPSSSAGLFSEFLSGPAWMKPASTGAASSWTTNTASKLGSFGFGFGGGGGGGGGNGNGNGNGNVSGGGGGGFGSLGGFGWGGNNGNNAAVEEEERRIREEEQRRLEEEQRNREREEEEEQQRVAAAAAEAERRRLEEEEAARKAEEEKVKQEEEDGGFSAWGPKIKKKPLTKTAKKAEEKKAKDAEEAARRAEEEAEAAKRAEEEAAAIARQAEEEAAAAAKKAEEDAEAATQAAEAAAAAFATAETPADLDAAATLATEAHQAEAEAEVSAQVAEAEAAEAKEKEGEEAEAKGEAAEAEEAADAAKNELDEAQKAFDDEWGPAITIKGKKGKKNAASNAATPDAISRTASGAGPDNQTGKKKGGGGKKKK